MIATADDNRIPETAWREASFFAVRGDRLLCELCPHACRLAEGETGFCGVRRNHRGRMQTATFCTTVRHLDPIERKPLYHVRPGRQVLTLAAPGCNLRCHYCQNYRLSQFGRAASVAWSARPVDVREVVVQAVQAGAALGLSYAEPGLSAELWLALAEAAAPFRLDLLWKSNGFLTESTARRFSTSLTAANLDLKTLDRRRHRGLTGADPDAVLVTMETWLAAGIWVEVSTPLIPGVNTSRAQLRSLARTIAGMGVGIPWHLVRFVPEYRLVRLPPTPPALIREAREIGLEAGLEFVYTERAMGAAGRKTCCPGCGALVVERGLWGLETNRLRNGACSDCGRSLPGRW